MNIMQFSFQMIRDRYVFLNTVELNLSIHTILFGHFFITGTLIYFSKMPINFAT